MNWNNLLKWVMGMAVIFFILYTFTTILMVGIKEGDIASAIIGGALIPTLTIVIQFFFRKASEKEKQ